MKKVFCFFVCLFSLTLLYAETIISFNEAEQDPDESITVLDYKPIRAGDKYVKLGIGLGIPLFNTSGTQFAIKPNMYPGPRIFVGMHFYVTDGLSLGGDLSFEFYTTLGKNLYFAVPFSFAIAYTFTHERWRFPLGINIGGIFMSYLGSRTCGLYLNPFFSFYYQYSPEWSFGSELNWTITTEFRMNKKYIRANNNLGVLFSVRYHF
ncbi:MAG: hypothetical protein IJU92_02405 [Spirochaetaceae bacterium]|nr:hypothetical protein [Spirochaetaceae bacterium]